MAQKIHLIFGIDLAFYDVTSALTLISGIHFSDYENHTYTLVAAKATTSGSGSFGPGITNAIWKLVLAMIFKLFITIFTFGMKVIRIIRLVEFLNGFLIGFILRFQPAFSSPAWL